MKNKIFLQFSIFFIFFVIASIFFKTYFSTKNNNITLIKKNYEKIDNQDADKSNLIHNIEYISNDNNKYNYIIKSKQGIQSVNPPNVTFMKDVLATINLNDKAPINISSKSAFFNNITYDTEFNGEVVVIYDEHKINAEKLNLLFKKNLAYISNEILYKNLNTQLQADKIEINLLTKNLKIFMNDKSKKIKILNIN